MRRQERQRAALRHTGDCSAAPHPLIFPSRRQPPTATLPFLLLPLPLPCSRFHDPRPRRCGHPPAASGRPRCAGARHPLFDSGIAPGAHRLAPGEAGGSAAGWRQSCQDGQILLQVVLLRSVRGRDGTFKFILKGKGRKAAVAVIKPVPLLPAGVSGVCASRGGGVGSDARLIYGVQSSGSPGTSLNCRFHTHCGALHNFILQPKRKGWIFVKQGGTTGIFCSNSWLDLLLCFSYIFNNPVEYKLERELAQSFKV